MNKRDVKNAKDLSKYLSCINSQKRLLEIIANKSLKLNNVIFLNDKKEAFFCHNRNYYIFSMTSEQEYVSMWQMYGKPSGIKIRIDFSKEKLLKCLDKKNIYYYETGNKRAFYYLQKKII